MNILYLTFYFEPDIGPGAFRNTALVRELARQLSAADAIHVLTTQPNRYQVYTPPAPEKEGWTETGCPVTIERIRLPGSAIGGLHQPYSFWRYARTAYRLSRNRQYDLVVASSSRLFTAFLAALLARRFRIPLFLDIRDLFRDVMQDMYPNWLLQLVLAPILRAGERYTFGRATHINLVSAGFASYFREFPQATYSYHTNGIDDVFLTIPASRLPDTEPDRKIILYAGNIGEGQGLHKIIPQAAQLLGDSYQFVVFGSGGAKHKLESAIRQEQVSNVELKDPIAPASLVVQYQQADYLFVHLNELPSLARVLPSKLFELGATDKPILAGVSGYAASFIDQYLTNCLVFAPCDAHDLVGQLRRTPYYTASRTDFRARFQREAITRNLARQILKTLEVPAPANVMTTKPTRL